MSDPTPTGPSTAEPSRPVLGRQGLGPAQVKPITHEKSGWSLSGGLGLIILLALLAGPVYLGWSGARRMVDGNGGDAQLAWGIVLFIVVFVLMGSCMTIVSPGDTKVLQFLGSYVGTIRRTGLRLVAPFTTHKRVSVKVRNFETRDLKVNDADGNPINIAAIVVWQVEDTAQSVFQVEDYQQFVTVQSEAALRHIASIHPYDNGAPGEPTLRGSTDLVAAQLADEVSERIAIAGLKVIETRISSLSFAPEIAQVMLQRQQAEAVLAARSRIVEGAVSMVQSALERLESDAVVQMDDERKAAMISNLLVVLCSDSRATPVVNTGSLYT
ncbi:MAG: SPFH domain-containing protein [Propionibacteriaceae bacterium]|jgi:regulator of protease activity HflC (stomatin/prohibitin superfamily)|nr:SPFH domain-containing protein [Propionibacteriaceae bacterium]